MAVYMIILTAIVIRNYIIAHRHLDGYGDRVMVETVMCFFVQNKGTSNRKIIACTCFILDFMVNVLL